MSNFLRTLILALSGTLVTNVALAQGAWEEAPPAEGEPVNEAPPGPAAQPAPPPPPPPPPAAAPAAPPGPQPGAAPPAAPVPPPPAIQVQTPPAPPRGPRRGAYVHDGFYLRMGLGISALRVEVDHEGAPVVDRTLSGGGLALDFLLGGSPERGLVLGGGLLANSAGDPDVDVDGAGAAEAYRNVSLSLVGMFVDGFFDPEGGFHAGGMLGIAVVDGRFEDDDVDVEPDRLGEEDAGPTGAGAAAWIGYAGWVGSEWSIGGMLRVMAATTGRETDDFTQRARGQNIALLFTALYH